MSPPPPSGSPVGSLRNCAEGGCFNIQDVFPDAAVRTRAITNRAVIRAAYRLERLSYRCADAVTVLSDDLADNVNAKLESQRSARTDVVVIPNFVDNNWLTPVDGSPYRDEFGLGDGPIVMYAGNLGYSQSLDLMIDLAEQRPEITVVINGDGAMRGHRYRGCAAAIKPASHRISTSTTTSGGAVGGRHSCCALAHRSWFGERPVKNVFDSCGRQTRDRRY